MKIPRLCSRRWLAGVVERDKDTICRDIARAVEGGLIRPPTRAGNRLHTREVLRVLYGLTPEDLA